MADGRQSTARRRTHRKLTHAAAARSVLALPFAKSITRRVARFAIQRLALSRKNKQRLYNLIAADAAWVRPVTCQVRMPSLRVGLDFVVDASPAKATTVFDVGANIGLYMLLAAAVFEADARFTPLSRTLGSSLGWFAMPI
jgi:hypothetical protein